MKIPYRSMIVTQEMKNAALRVIDTGKSYGGEDTERFEVEMAAFCGAAYGVTANSGTSAMMLALAAKDVGRGDEVIMGANDYVGVLGAVVRVGATPIFVDTEADTGNIAVDAVDAAITERTRAVVGTHLYGHPCDMDAILELSRKHDLFVIEDVAHALGAEYKGKRVGGIGHVGFSSFSGKHITVFGPGGINVTNDEQLAEDLSSLRDQGRARAKNISFIRRTDAAWYDQKFIGFNMHMTEISAALGRIQLGMLDGFLARRRKAAAHYDQVFAGAGLPLVLPPQKPYAKHAYLHYVVLTPQREQLRSFLQSRGIETSIHYPAPLHFLEPVQDQFGDQKGKFPTAEKVAAEILSLPVGPHLTDDQIEYIAASVVEYFQEVHAIAD